MRQLPRPLALVLGGGGSLGALQVGMLQTLRDAGVSPDMVVGTSVGALNGAVIAERGLPAAVPHLEQVWLSTRRRDVLAVGLSSLRSLARRRPVFESSGIVRLVRTHVGAGSFEQLDRPLVVVATDATSGEPAAFDRGGLAAAVTASAAIPGVFAAVEIGGKWYVDGGVSANLPIAMAHSRGAASIIALDVISLPVTGLAPEATQPPKSILASALFGGGVMFRRQRNESLRLAAAELPVLVLEAPVTGVHPLNFSEAPQLIAEGNRSARQTIEGLSIRGRGLYGTALAGC